MADALNRIRGPFNVNGPAIAAGIAAGLGFARLASPTHRHARAVGAAIAAVGVVMATGVI